MTCSPMGVCVKQAEAVAESVFADPESRCSVGVLRDRIGQVVVIAMFFKHVRCFVTSSAGTCIGSVSRLMAIPACRRSFARRGWCESAWALRCHVFGRLADLATRLPAGFPGVPGTLGREWLSLWLSLAPPHGGSVHGPSCRIGAVSVCLAGLPGILRQVVYVHVRTCPVKLFLLFSTRLSKDVVAESLEALFKMNLGLRLLL